MVSVGAAGTVDIGAVATGLGDRASETESSVGAGSVAVDPDAGGGDEGMPTVGEATVLWAVLVGPLGAGVPVEAILR